MIQNRFSNSNFAARKEGTVVAAGRSRKPLECRSQSSLKEARVNIRAFYDAVLELGSVPLPVVTARIDRFIAEGGKGPYPGME